MTKSAAEASSRSNSRTSFEAESAVPRTLSRSEEDEHRQVLRDVMEAMRHRRGHEDDRAGDDVAYLLADCDLPRAGHDVVDLVFGVRLLEIRLAGCEDVQADAQIGDGQKLEIGAGRRRAPGGEIGKLECVHRRRAYQPGNHPREQDVACPRCRAPADTSPQRSSLLSWPSPRAARRRTPARREPRSRRPV